MLSRTQIAAIDDLADRIETAYLRKHPQRPWNSPDPRLWELVARSLIEAHRSTPWLPVDPELFVACQSTSSSPVDPWVDLATGAATRRYRRRVERMVERLLLEILGEILLARAKLEQGNSLDEILRRKKRAISPLGRYLVANLYDRDDLAERFRVDAEDQHAACPLYRAACEMLSRTADEVSNSEIPEDRRPIREIPEDRKSIRKFLEDGRPIREILEELSPEIREELSRVASHYPVVDLVPGITMTHRPGPPPTAVFLN